MAPKIDDRWLWLGFGVFIFFAAKGIRYAITDIVQLTKLDAFDCDSKDQNKDEQPEDSKYLHFGLFDSFYSNKLMTYHQGISLENLKILAESPDPNISNAAISLIVSRFRKSPEAKMAMIRDHQSKDKEIYNRAKTANDFLAQWGDLPGSAPRRHSRSVSLDSSPQVSIEEDTPLTDDGGGGAEWADGIVVPSPLNPVAGWTDVPRERPLSGDVDELERRRNRREAMVLHEGAGSLAESDIIRPQL